MAYTSILGSYEIVPCETCHIDSCVAMALENGENQQAYNRKVLGEALWESAFGGWRESLESAVREQQAGETAYVLLENGLFAGFGAFRCAGKVGTLGICHGRCAEELTELYMFLLAEMKQKGALCAVANWEDDPASGVHLQALTEVGFQKNLPHVRYFQTLPEAPVLPETDLQIVLAREEHVEDCVNIALKLWTVIHGGYARLTGDDIHDITWENWQADHRVNIANQQRRPTSLVALLDGKVVGFCGCRVENGTLGVIGYNGVDPEYRGRGIARYLYEAVFDQFRSQGICHARVFTGGDDGHGPARRAYEKAGFDKRLLSVTFYKTL